MSKKIVAILMAVAMAFSLLPVTAFAEGENAPVAPTTIYVSTTGTEGADGTESNPFQTIQDAVSYIEKQQKSESTNATWIISVAEGTYSRFLVPHGVKNITIQGSGDKTVIKTLDDSSLSVDESRVHIHNSDGQGIIVWGANITLKDLKIISGTCKKNKWYASAVGTHDDKLGSDTEVSTPVILDHCTFVGQGTGYAFMPQREAFTVQNCSFDNYEQAINSACDGYSANNCKVIHNTIKNCTYAIHGYYGTGQASAAMEIANNTISGQPNRFAVIAVLDQNLTGAVKLNIHDNTFSYTIVGGINQRVTDEDGIISPMSNVLTTNTMLDHSFAVDAYRYSASDYGTTFYAPKQEGKIATWYADPTAEAGNNIEAIKNALTDYGTAGQIIEINAPAQEIFTLAKNAIAIEDYVDAGDLKITKTVSNNEADNTEFSFTVKLTRPATESTTGDTDTSERPLNGYYDVIMADGTTQTQKLNNGELTVTMKNGQSVTIKDLLPGTQFTVTEANNALYTSTDTGATGVIAAKETQIAAFTNTYTPKWTISKSKTATNLDSNYESKVTLSLPSAEEKLDSDIVFVVDKSESSEKESALSMLDAIRNQIDKGTKVNVGVVTFNTVATQNGFFDLNADYEAIKEKFDAPAISGTNLHAGILAGVDMLNKSSTDNNRKYLIVISDGITYTYGKDAKIVPYYWLNDGQPYFSKDPYSWDFKYGAGTTFTTDQWNTWRSKVENILKRETISPVLYSERETLTEENGVLAPQDGNYTSSVDRALYYSYLAYQSASEKYHCYAIPAHTSKESTYPYGVSFMKYLGGNKEASFNEIKNDILYLIDTGSYVEDYMGYVDGNYNFNFINDASKLTITVGRGDAQEKLDAVKIDDNHYGFGPVTVETDSSDKVTTYRYNLEYIPGNMTDTEHFVWRINVPVENLAPVALTYSVKLVNPKSASGTYGQYDEDGSKEYSGLYTNNSATLHPKDSNENWGIPENFQKPTVSYTVSGGNSGGNNGGSSKPSLNTKDHYGYIIGYPVDYYTGEATTDQTKKPVRPEGKITRAEVATIYFRMLTDESRTKFWSQNSGYSDVKTGDWFNNAVSTLSNAGIIAGYEDGSFRPNGYITRAEFATIAARFFDVTYNGKDLFPDISGHWAKDYINQAANKGFVNGYEDGTFKPDRNITRAEAVTLVNRTLDRHPDKNHFTKDMLVWPDNMDQTKWYYADMQEATNSHTYQMKENSDKTKYENWTKTLPIRNWEALEKAWSNANSSQGNGNVV